MSKQLILEDCKLCPHVHHVRTNGGSFCGLIPQEGPGWFYVGRRLEDYPAIPAWCPLPETPAMKEASK